MVWALHVQIVQERVDQRSELLQLTPWTYAQQLAYFNAHYSPGPRLLEELIPDHAT
jgi:hypothetical protein